MINRYRNLVILIMFLSRRVTYPIIRCKYDLKVDDVDGVDGFPNIYTGFFMDF
jgi:hypothetical protein